MTTANSTTAMALNARMALFAFTSFFGFLNSLCRRFFFVVEQVFLQKTTEADFYFTLLWTCKEALAKCLDIALTEVCQNCNMSPLLQTLKTKPSQGMHGFGNLTYGGYDIYFENYSFGSNKNDIIFGDIYKFLMKEDIESLQCMLERLLAATNLTLRVCRQYIFVWLGTVVTIICMFILALPGILRTAGIVLVLAAFGYKSIVYMINRFCYVDANITLIYKTALYHRILTVNMNKIKTIK